MDKVPLKMKKINNRGREVLSSSSSLEENNHVQIVPNPEYIEPNTERTGLLHNKPRVSYDSLVDRDEADEKMNSIARLEPFDSQRLGENYKLQRSHTERYEFEVQIEDKKEVGIRALVVVFLLSLFTFFVWYQSNISESVIFDVFFVLHMIFSIIGFVGIVDHQRRLFEIYVFSLVAYVMALMISVTCFLFLSTAELESGKGRHGSYIDKRAEVRCKDAQNIPDNNKDKVQWKKDFNITDLKKDALNCIKLVKEELQWEIVMVLVFFLIIYCCSIWKFWQQREEICKDLENDFCREQQLSSGLADEQDTKRSSMYSDQERLKGKEKPE